MSFDDCTRVEAGILHSFRPGRIEALERPLHAGQWPEEDSSAFRGVPRRGLRAVDGSEA